MPTIIHIANIRDSALVSKNKYQVDHYAATCSDSRQDFSLLFLDLHRFHPFRLERDANEDRKQRCLFGNLFFPGAHVSGARYVGQQRWNT